MKTAYRRLEKDVYGLLMKEIDPCYVYHNVNHTLDVLESVDRISKYENMNETETLLLRTAALFHDVGYIRQYEKNEIIAAQIAAEMLPGYGYSPGQISTISRMIQRTAYPLDPGDYLDGLLCDADLDYLGREDYFSKSMLLFREWRNINCGMNLTDWYLLQIDFLGKHRYISEFSRKYREPKKKEILLMITQLMNA